MSGSTGRAEVGSPRRRVSSSLSLRDLYAAYSENRLFELAAKLRTADLAIFLDGWFEWVLVNGGMAQTGATYRAQVETLIGRSFPASELTGPRISRWLTEIPEVTTGTRRKYLYALRSFIRYLIEQGVLDSNPAATVRAPKRNPPRLRWETEENDRRIVNAASPKVSRPIRTREINRRRIVSSTSCTEARHRP